MFELLLITDPGAPRGLVGSVRAALAGVPGERLAVQLRAKRLSPAELGPIAREIRAITAGAGARMLLNGSLELALEVGADGVHLPEAGPRPAGLRPRLGAEFLIGASCHDPTGLAAAAEGGASFATLSPVYPSPGKGRPLGSAQFATWTRSAALPVFALGGVSASNAGELRRAGASGLAVISAVFGADDPAAAVRAIVSAWDHFPAT